MCTLKEILEKSISEAAKEYPVIMVAGQRQVGKSTTLNHIKEKTYFFGFLPKTYRFWWLIYSDNRIIEPG